MPAAFISIGYCIAVRINAHFESYPNTMNNVLHFKSESVDPSEAECLQVAQLVSAWGASDYALNISADWTIDSVEAWSAFSETGAYALVSEPCPGTLAPTNQPDAAPLVLLKTGTRGRSYTGRFYALAPAEAEIGQQQYTATRRNGLIDAFRALRDTSATAGFPLAVASPTLGQVTVCSEFTTSARLTKQTRRRLGFGG